jgi:predicted TPR repeat methyltransferase
MTHETTTAEFFDSLYLKNPDPWNFERSSYERSRYDAIIDAIAHRRYERAFEPGCSIGVLTEALARFCDHLIAVDISPTAVARSQKRCRHLSNVDVRRGALPEDLPEGKLDLIVFSEIGYYFDESELDRLTARLADKLSRGGTLLAVHWLGASTDHVISGDQVHAVMRSCPQFVIEDARRFPSFRLDRLVRR